MGIEVEKERERRRVRAASYDSTKGGRDLRGISDPHLLLAPWRNRQREVGKLGYPDNFLRSKDPVATRNTFPPSFSFVLFLSLSLSVLSASLLSFLFLLPLSIHISIFRPNLSPSLDSDSLPRARKQNRPSSYSCRVYRSTLVLANIVYAGRQNSILDSGTPHLFVTFRRSVSSCSYLGTLRFDESLARTISRLIIIM